MNWLAFQGSFLLTFLILECGTVPQLSPVWVQVQVHLQVQEHLLQFSTFLLILKIEKQKQYLILSGGQDPVIFSQQNCVQHSFIGGRRSLKLGLF